MLNLQIAGFSAGSPVSVATRFVGKRQGFSRALAHRIQLRAAYGTTYPTK